MSIKDGRTVLVHTDGNLSTGIESEALEESTTWSVIMQVLGGAPTAPILAFVKYWQGDASFSLPAMSLGVGITRLLVSGRKVQVDLLGEPGDTLANHPVSLGLSKGATLQGPEAGGNWLATGLANANLYSFPGQAGTVRQATANVVNFNGAASAYVLLFDQLAAPGNGATPIPGGRSSLLAPGSSSAEFDGAFTPLTVTTKLWVALSSTPDALTLVPGGTFTFDFFQGVQ